MKRTSWRTLILLMELFIAVASFQYLAVMKPVPVGALWLAGGSASTASAPCEVNDCNLGG